MIEQAFNAMLFSRRMGLMNDDRNLTRDEAEEMARMDINQLTNCELLEELALHEEVS